MASTHANVKADPLATRFPSPLSRSVAGRLPTRSSTRSPGRPCLASFPPGRLCPRERALAERFGVSRLREVVAGEQGPQQEGGCSRAPHDRDVSGGWVRSRELD